MFRVNNGVAKISLNPERPGDYKEAYNCTPPTAKIFPDEDVHGFKDTLLEFCRLCANLTKKILYLMGIGLGLKDPEIFTQSHNFNTSANVSTTRCLFYPPLPDSVDIKPNQIRCGEHSDYGSVTLLFQDDIGGLEVFNRNNEWVAATPVKDAILVNVGDLMQRWTSDVLVSTKHRVLIPEDEANKKAARQSIAYFAHPDNDCVVTCIDGSDKYPPISAWDYLIMRFNETY